MKSIIQTIKNSYYSYVPGEFLPVFYGGKLINKRAFHEYKLRRAIWMIRNYKFVLYVYTHDHS